MMGSAGMYAIINGITTQQPIADDEVILAVVIVKASMPLGNVQPDITVQMGHHNEMKPLACYEAMATIVSNVAKYQRLVVEKIADSVSITS